MILDAMIKKSSCQTPKEWDTQISSYWIAGLFAAENQIPKGI